MKKLKLSVNNKLYEMSIGYDEENNELIVEIKDSKGEKLDKRRTRIILNELIKDFRVVKSTLSLKQLERNDSPIILYTDEDDKIVPALFYKNNDFDYMNQIDLTIPKLKREEVLSITSHVLSWFLLLGMIINFCSSKLDEKEFNQNIKIQSQTVSENFDSAYIRDSIYLNENLSDELKEYLANSDFINALATTQMTLEERTILCYQLRNLKISEYNLLERGISDVKDLFSNTSTLGYVSNENYNQNEIHLRQPNNKRVLLHEFIHVTQNNSEYFYLKESCSEIFCHEYWNTTIDSYTESVKRIYALAYIIGPEAIWNANFTSTNQLEEELSKYLNPEEVKIFMECLKVRPTTQKIDETTGIGEIDKELDRLLSIMYEKKFGEPYKDNYMIKGIYNMSNNGSVIFEVDGEIKEYPICLFNIEEKENKKIDNSSKTIVKQK